MTDYPFGIQVAVSALDENNVVRDGDVWIYATTDVAGTTPLTLTDLTGLPLTNPLRSNGIGYTRAFITNVPQVKWKSGVHEGLFDSYAGMRDEAVQAKVAAQVSASSALESASLAKAPTDAQVDAGILRADVVGQISAQVPPLVAPLVAAQVPPLVASSIASDPTIANAAATMAQSTAGLVPVWKANTAYAINQKVIAPNGDVVSAKAAHTSGASYTAANWNPSTQDGRLAAAESNGVSAFKNLGTLANGTDIDTLTTTGYHPFTNSGNAATMLNLPVPFAGTLEVFYPSASVAFQRFTTFGDINGNANTGFWVRHRQSSTTWGPWWKVGEAFLGAELVASAGAPVNLDTFATAGVFDVRSATTAQYISGLPTSKPGTLENLKPRTANLWTQRFTVQGLMTSHLDGQHSEIYTRTMKTAGVWNPWQRHLTESVGTIGEGDLALEATTASFIPLSIGIDGYVYGTTGDTSITARSGDALATDPELGADFDTFAGPGGGVAYLTRTSSGYVAFRIVSTTATEIWYATSFAGPYTKVQDIGPFHLTGVAKPVTIAGVTWLLMGEYINGVYPSTSLRRWLSIDGGLTWRVVKQTPLIDVNTNSHHHTGLIRPNGRIYTSDGDGDNNFFGYSDDLGKTWVPVATDPDVQLDGTAYAQPTTLIDFGDAIAMSPDRGPYTPGIWRLDPDTGSMRIVFELAVGGPYGNAAAQYGRSLYAQVGPQGKQAYMLMPDGGSGNKTAFVIATPDGGKRWRIVATIPWGAGQLRDGVVGPDRRGYVFMRGFNVPTYGSNAIRAKLIEWDKISV